MNKIAFIQKVSNDLKSKTFKDSKSESKSNATAVKGRR